MNQREKLAIYLIVGAIVVAALGSQVKAATDAEGSTIVVEVAQKTMIDLTPASFTWTGLDPGSTGSVMQAQIENIGSTNLTKIWFNVTQPSDRPFGTGTNASYDSGNYVWIARESGDYYAVDRVEFNESRSLVYLTDPDGNTPPDGTKYSYGRFRDAGSEYFWMLDKSSGNCAGATFYIGDLAHTKTQTGSVDFSSCSAGLNNAPGTGCRYGTLTAATGGGWCYADVNIGGKSYVVAVDNSTLGYKIRWSHWNQDLPGADSASNDETFYTGNLYPGGSTVANITVHVPFGVAMGYSHTGTLYVIGSNS